MDNREILLKIIWYLILILEGEVCYYLEDYDIRLLLRKIYIKLKRIVCIRIFNLINVWIGG